MHVFMYACVRERVAKWDWALAAARGEERVHDGSPEFVLLSIVTYMLAKVVHCYAAPKHEQASALRNKRPTY